MGKETNPPENILESWIFFQQYNLISNVAEKKILLPVTDLLVDEKLRFLNFRKILG